MVVVVVVVVVEVLCGSGGSGSISKPLSFLKENIMHFSRYL